MNNLNSSNDLKKLNDFQNVNQNNVVHNIEANVGNDLGNYSKNNLINDNSSMSSKISWNVQSQSNQISQRK